MSADSDPAGMIRALLGSEAVNYLESAERLHLGTYLEKIKTDPLDHKETEILNRIFRKYRKYL